MFCKPFLFFYCILTFSPHLCYTIFAYIKNAVYRLEIIRRIEK